MKPAAFASLVGLTLSACAANIVPPVVRPSPALVSSLVAKNASYMGLLAGPDLASLTIDAAAAGRALIAFRESCPGLLKRDDRSGLTKANEWQPVCDAARTNGDVDQPAFFQTWFETVRVGDGAAFATGYYEPEIAGSRTPSPAYPVPVYGIPGDLLTVELGDFSPALAGKTIRGRQLGSTLMPYFDRAEIEDGALNGRGIELAWAADPVEFFFLQVQGSGRLRFPDGTLMRIGYAGQNGRDYTGIGKLMREQGLIGPDQLSMQGIMAWLRANPERGREIMRENKSFVFFRELTGPGPVGAMNVPVTPRATVAADPLFVPLGSPVLLAMDRVEANGLWIAQDTGGAIKGANRFDTFWGAGDEARRIAGGMSARGTAFILLPKGTLARLAADGTTPRP